MSCSSILRNAKEIEERLRVSEEEIRLAMEQMGRVICLYDIKTHMLTMPAAYVKNTAFPPIG